MGRTSKPLAPAIEFGHRVRATREKQGLSQERLAQASGFHTTYISSVERGERNVSLMTILRLAAALEMDPGRLVRGLTAEGP